MTIRLGTFAPPLTRQSYEVEIERPMRAGAVVFIALSSKEAPEERGSFDSRPGVRVA
jgi:hypothetical protein